MHRCMSLCDSLQIENQRGRGKNPVIFHILIQQNDCPYHPPILTRQHPNYCCCNVPNVDYEKAVILDSSSFESNNTITVL